MKRHVFLTPLAVPFFITTCMNMRDLTVFAFSFLHSMQCTTDALVLHPCLVALNEMGFAFFNAEVVVS